MAAMSDHSRIPRTVRQLRRVRAFYATGVALWLTAAIWTGWMSPGSRQMWVSVLLLTLFAGLLGTATLWLQRLRTRSADAPAHHAAPGRKITARHA
ncbi:DUF2530 domain-containing protein [Streptomyces sp. NPDC090023]|uniref:DUF2530 domain-containing protein n=1 Tax=unclassified Streptomyces TaxID=2593676 RepID=UPI00381F72FB